MQDFDDDDDDHAMDCPRPQRSGPIGLRWDGTVSAGNLLTSIALGSSLLIWGVRLEDRLDKEEHMRAAIEQRIDRFAEQQRLVDVDIEVGIRRMDDKITTLLMNFGIQQPSRERGH